MTARNDITGDELKSKTNSEAYRDNYDRIFGNKRRKDNEQSTQTETGKPTTEKSQQGSCQKDG